MSYTKSDVAHWKQRAEWAEGQPGARRPFSDKLAQEVIAGQVKEIERLTALIQEERAGRGAMNWLGKGQTISAALTTQPADAAQFGDLGEVEAQKEHWRQWAINGMPADKRRLAAATWDAAWKAARAHSSRVHGMDALELARFFHDTYERLAPEYGYETRAETRRFESGSANGRLMQAVCAEVLQRLTPSSTRDSVLTEAMEAIAKEHLEEPQGDEDHAYDLGVTDAYCAVKRMLSKYTLPEAARGMANDIAQQIENGAPGDSQANR